MRFTRILVPLDGSRLAEAVMPAARSLAAKLGARVLLLHVLEREPPEAVHGEPHLGTSQEALTYLESLGDANPVYPNVTLTDAETAAVVGNYAFGPGPTERLTVARNARGIMTLQRPGFSERNIWHEGNLAFIPAGAEAVRIRFEAANGKAQTLAVEDGPVIVRGKRVSA